MKCKYRIIVSIDGGGIRGVLPLVILDHIQKKVSEYFEIDQIQQCVDLYAGTSTGAIIGSALMLQDKKGKYIYSLEKIKSLYMHRGQQIFNKTLHDSSIASSVSPLKLVLENNFGAYDISSIRKHFLFTSYDIVSDSPFIFMDKMERFRDVALSKVLLACCALPGLFTPVKFGSQELVDGIIAAKNPSMLSYDYIKLYYPNDPIILLSFGTGKLGAEKEDYIEREMQATHKQLKQISLRDPNLIYYRFQPDLNNANTEIGDTSPGNIMALEQDAFNFIANNKPLFESLYDLIEIKVA